MDRFHQLVPESWADCIRERALGHHQENGVGVQCLLPRYRVGRPRAFHLDTRNGNTLARSRVDSETDALKPTSIGRLADAICRARLARRRTRDRCIWRRPTIVKRLLVIRTRSIPRFKSYCLMAERIAPGTVRLRVHIKSGEFDSFENQHVVSHSDY
jgi:hypothetical protein